MASIKKRTSKDGKVSYSISVFIGVDVNGKQITKSTTWKPPTGMRESAADKQAQKEAVLFEEKVKSGVVTIDGNIKFADYAAYWLENAEFRINTRDTAKKRLSIINQAIGHIPLEKLRVEHLQAFYKNLREDGTGRRPVCATSMNLKKRMVAAGIKWSDIVKAAGCSGSTVWNAMKGKRVMRDSAKLITKALADMGVNTKDLFVYEQNATPLSPSTIKTYHETISQILAAAKKSRILPHSIIEYMDAPKGTAPEARYLDDEQAREYLLALLNEPDIRIRTVFITLLFTGLRRSELCGLEWQDIDFLESKILVRRASHYVPRVGVYESEPKTRGSARNITVMPFLMEVLSQYKEWQDNIAGTLGDAWKNEKQRLFTAQDGSPINPTIINGWSTMFHKKSGLPHVNPHALRHTFATLQLAAGVDWRTLASRTGHSNPSTLLNTYSHAIKSAQDKAAKKLDNMLLPQEPKQLPPGDKDTEE